MKRVSRRSVLRLGSALALAPAGCSGRTHEDAGDPRIDASADGARAAVDGRRNVVFLLADDQRWDTIGALGNPIIETPNLDDLARAGTVFENNFVTTSICPISRASILTGLYARHHGVLDFSTPLSERQLAAGYPGRLREAGHLTGLIGKYGLGGELPHGSFDQLAAFSGQGEYFPDDGSVHLTTLLGDEAVSFLRRASSESRPFCLSVSFKAPHPQNVTPYFGNDPAFDGLYVDRSIPPADKSDPAFFEALPPFLREGYRGRREFEYYFATPERHAETVRRYYRLISGIDAQVGRIRSALADLGLDRTTAVVFTSDNGMFTGERGLGGKWLMHEESIRTPMIVLDPLTPSSWGRRCRQMTLNIDVCPTLCALAGVTPPPGLDGSDLTPLMRGEPTPWREEWFYEHPFDHPEIPMSEGVRSTEWKLITYVDAGPEHDELYDLVDDPRETTNLAADASHRGVLDDMRRRHRAWVSRLS